MPPPPASPSTESCRHCCRETASEEKRHGSPLVTATAPRKLTLTWSMKSEREVSASEPFKHMPGPRVNFRLSRWTRMHVKDAGPPRQHTAAHLRS